MCGKLITNNKKYYQKFITHSRVFTALKSWDPQHYSSSESPHTDKKILSSFISSQCGIVYDQYIQCSNFIIQFVCHMYFVLLSHKYHVYFIFIFQLIHCATIPFLLVLFFSSYFVFFIYSYKIIHAHHTCKHMYTLNLSITYY